MRTLGQYMAGSGATFGFVTSRCFVITRGASTDVAQLLYVYWQHHPIRCTRGAPRIISKCATASDRSTSSPSVEKGVMIPLRVHVVSIYGQQPLCTKTRAVSGHNTLDPVRLFTCIYLRSLSGRQSRFGYRTALCDRWCHVSVPMPAF
jgi:hypothetical protein